MCESKGMANDRCIWLSPEDRVRLEGWVAGRNTPQKLVWRARIVLMWAEGAGVTAIVRSTGKTKRTAYRWHERYLERGIAGLERDASRPGRKPPLSVATIERVVHMTLHETPPAGTHWSVRKLAKAVGLSPSSVQRIWAAHGLKPHLRKTFKLSNDKRFVEKLRDIVGLYLDPPDRALVLCVDEKSQIQALDRTQPLLPMRPGQPERNRPCVKYGKTSGLERSTARVHGSASRLSDRSFETFMHKNRIDPRPNCKPRRASGYG